MTFSSDIFDENPELKERSTGEEWGSSGNAATSGLSRFLIGREGLEVPEILALARDIGKTLSTFKIPEGYHPEPPRPEPELTPAMIRALGTPTLSDYFIQTLKSSGNFDNVHESCLAVLPRGSESLKGALVAVEQLLDSYNRAAMADPRRYNRQRTELLAMKTSLLRVGRQYPQFRGMVEEWPREAKSKLTEARRLTEAARLLTQSASQEGGVGFHAGGIPVSITFLTTSLKEKLSDSRGVLERRRRWYGQLKLFLQELESLLATVSIERENRNWKTVVHGLERRLTEFRNEHKELSERRLETDRGLRQARTQLEEGERDLVGQRDNNLKERCEALTESVNMLWRSTVTRRTELAECWQQLPALVGRPLYLEKIFLASALDLGRSQALLEEIKNRLSLITGRLSSTRNIRSAAAEILDQGQSREFPALLKQAGRWLVALTSAVTSRLEAGGKEQELHHLKNKTDEYVIEAGGLRQQLSAVSAERDRLSDDLLEAKRRLTEVAKIKISLLKTLKERQRIKDESVHEHNRLEVEIAKIKDQVSFLRRSHTRVNLIYNRDRKRLKELEQLNLQLSEDKNKYEEQVTQNLERHKQLLERLKGYKEEIANLTSNRQELTNLSQHLKEELDLVRSRETSLSVELRGREEELTEANRVRQRLSQVIVGYRRQMDNLLMAHNALKNSWRRRGTQLAESEADRDRLSFKLDRQKRNMVRLVTQRQQLLAELGSSRLRFNELEEERKRLFEELEQARAEAGKSQESEVRLNGELEALRNEMEGDLKPFIQILGMALWRSEAQLKAVETSANTRIETIRLASQASEAGVRIASAAREIDYLEVVESREKELEKLRVELDQAKEQLDSVDPEQDKNLSWLSQNLSLALVSSNQRRERLRRGLRDFRHRMDTQLTEAESIRADLNDLLKNQTEALSDHKAWLSELVPLVGFFLQSAQTVWAGPVQDDFRDALLYFMRNENANLSEELGRIKNEKQSLLAERVGLLAVQGEMKERLIELQPLVGFLVKKFVENSAALARAWSDRDQLVKDMETRSVEVEPELEPLVIDLDSSAIVSDVQEPPAALLEELETARQQMGTLADEKKRLETEVEKRASEVAKAQADLKVLVAEKSKLAGAVASQDQKLTLVQSEKEGLLAEKQNLSAEKDNLSVEKENLSVEKKKLSAEKQRLEVVLSDREVELAEVRKQLELIKTEAGQAEGRLESAWAALNYLGARTGDALVQLRRQLDVQARGMEESHSELNKRDELIKDLELRQDRLAMLYWTLVNMAVSGRPVARLENGGKGKPEVDESEDEKTEADDKELLEKNGRGGGFLSHSFLAGVRKAARKGLFSMFLTGGLVLAWPTNLHSYPALEPSLLPTPDKIFDVSTTVDPEQIATRMYCRYLGRTIDLGFMSTDDRTQGRDLVEVRAEEQLSSQAKDWGVPTEAWLKLIREAHGQDETVFMSDLSSDEAPLLLIRHQLPILAEALQQTGLTGSLARPILMGMASFKNHEGPFWDRLFMDFQMKMGNVREAAFGLSGHLFRRNTRALSPVPEFAGRLAPIVELENMTPETGLVFLSGHMRNFWGRGDSRRKLPHINELRRLSADILFASHLFKIPVTLLSCLNHVYFDHGRAWPSTLEVYGLAQTLSRLIVVNSQIWQTGQPPLCDLDDLALLLINTRYEFQTILKKKLSLQGSININLNRVKDLLVDTSVEDELQDEGGLVRRHLV